MSAARIFAENNRNDLIRFEMLEDTARDMGELRKELDAILRSPDPSLTSEERKQTMDRILFLMIDGARDAVQGVKRAIREERKRSPFGFVPREAPGVQSIGRNLADLETVLLQGRR